MSGSLRIYRKTALERRRLYIDYSCWLEDAETLSEFQVNIAPYTEATPIVATTSYPDAGQKKLMVFVSGGAAGTQYTLSFVIRTSAGQVKQDDIGMMVTS